jgi:hypothetical protein
MSFRAQAAAVAATAVAALSLAAPAALASTHGPVQVIGKQLKSALIPASGFLPGYHTIFQGNSGGSLEHGATRSIPPMNCFIFWASIGVDKGYGETAFADEMAGSGSNPVPVAEIFDQAVYQFANSRGAASLYSQISAKYRSCRKVSVRDTQGGTLTQLVHARYTQRVGGHRALLLIEYLTDTKIPGPPTVTYALWTLDGTNVYMVSSQLFNTTTPQPSLSSLTLKLIGRVTALR